MSTPQLIQCGDHKWAPWAIICVHLMEGTAKRWIPLDVDDGREVEHDFMCPTCYAKWEAEDENNHNLDDLRCVCIHCLRKIKEENQRT